MKSKLKTRKVRYADIPKEENNWDAIRVWTTKIHRSSKRTKIALLGAMFFICVFWWAMFSAQADQLAGYYRTPLK